MTQHEIFDFIYPLVVAGWSVFVFLLGVHVGSRVRAGLSPIANPIPPRQPKKDAPVPPVKPKDQEKL